MARPGDFTAVGVKTKYNSSRCLPIYSYRKMAFGMLIIFSKGREKVCKATKAPLFVIVNFECNSTCDSITISQHWFKNDWHIYEEEEFNTALQDTQQMQGYDSNSSAITDERTAMSNQCL